MKPKYPRGSLERAVEYIKTKGKKKSKTRAYGILFFAFFIILMFHINRY